ncbi:MAG TPA: hypothetical protein VJH92_03305 [Candidatus Nanoarchaeia archaeon]|nr:hypothetical protein [Candidatus Nanoarchaeia archaeon]
MDRGQTTAPKKTGIIIGYIISFFVFSLILFLILDFSNKISEKWNLFYILPFTLCIVLFGNLIQLWLK